MIQLKTVRKQFCSIFMQIGDGPCRMVSPLVDEIAEENQQYLVGKINVDEEPQLAQAFGVTTIPTLVVMKNGQIVEQSAGARPKEQILEMLEG